MADDREQLVQDAVEQTKRLADQAKEVARAEARVAAHEVKDALAPAAPALKLGAAALGLGLVGLTFVVLPWAAKAASHPIACGVIGGAAIGAGIVAGQRAWDELPPGLGDRIRSLLRQDMTTAIEAATEPTRH